MEKPFATTREDAVAIYEAVDAGIRTIFCITEHIPALDMLRVVAAVDAVRVESLKHLL